MAAARERATVLRGPVTPAEAAQIAADTMTEATLQAQIEGVLKTFGWRYYHTRFSVGSAGGFPDLVAIRGPRLIFAELKRQADRYQPTPKQQAWLDDLVGVGQSVDAAVRYATPAVGQWPAAGHPSVEVYLWRPLDITSTPNRIVEVLR